MKVIVALCCLVVVFAQDRPCESPKQWEGRVVEFDPTVGFLVAAKISYDETNQRVRRAEELDVGDERDYYDVLYLHNIGKEYRLNFRTRKCNVTQLTRPFRPSGVPPEAQFDGSASLGLPGLPGESLIIENFSVQRGDERYFGHVTSPDCYPVQSNFFSSSTGLVTTSYYDIHEGISDPNVFIPPHECFML